MADRSGLALEATRRIRGSPAFRSLRPDERSQVAADLDRIEHVLGADPFSGVLETPLDLQRTLQQPATRAPAAPTGAPAASAPAAERPRTGAVDRIGQQAARTLEAVDFPGFVAGLVNGTFQAIVDSTAQQMRQYAELVASLARTVDDFSRDNVTVDQVRVWLAERYPADLRLDVPPPGSGKVARLLPRAEADGSSPAWLERYGLAGETLSEELTEGALLGVGRRSLAEERMQHLATMVLMGVNRIVVDQGSIKAKLQFHAQATDRTTAEVKALTLGQKAGIAAQQTSLEQGASAMVSTVRANVQADAQVKADLMGEVNIQFRTETFPLERFADSPAIQLLQRHARWTAETPAAPAPAPVRPAEGT